MSKKAHETSAFYGSFDSALLLGSESRSLAAHDSAVWIYELLKKVYVLVVYVSNVVLSKYVHIVLLIKMEYRPG